MSSLKVPSFILVLVGQFLIRPYASGPCRCQLLVGVFKKDSGTRSENQIFEATYGFLQPSVAPIAQTGGHGSERMI